MYLHLNTWLISETKGLVSMHSEFLMIEAKHKGVVSVQSIAASAKGR